MFSFLTIKMCVILLPCYIHASPAGNNTRIMFSFLEDSSKQNKTKVPAFEGSIYVLDIQTVSELYIHFFVFQVPLFCMTLKPQTLHRVQCLAGNFTLYKKETKDKKIWVCVLRYQWKYLWIYFNYNWRVSLVTGAQEFLWNTFIWKIGQLSVWNLVLFCQCF